MTNKEKALQRITELVARFEEQFASYKKSDYNETLTRKDFIDPFFKVLGWDMDNEQGHAEAYRDVIHEDKLKIGSATKAPDYSFRLGGGKRLFFVEAKKPSIVVKDDILPAYQVRRYGWSAKLAISIVTDFEEFAIYDCTKKPVPTDKASVARIKYMTFQDYITEFEFLWDTFSKERVLQGSFDKFVIGTAHKKGTVTVDKEFLKSLDQWRTYLATSISWNNKDLDVDEINFAVQQTIDRIIFLRIAEDRSVEPYGNLKSAIKQGDFYKNLFDIFKEADQKYNSGLFDFKKDQISSHLKVDNKVIKTVINELYYPESPYEFSVLSVEILGSAYEQFLGKTITIDKAHRAKIEEKPEVRKAGGVYYTPQYIVDYIVEHTVGTMIENKTPDDVSQIKIVDPACGSGSFLIGAYQYLLDWHKNYYFEQQKTSKNKKGIPLTPEGNLTTGEKKRILLNNIYGVDIDVNAVEVTKLSLLLKCMEGETLASISHQMTMFNERVLPTLDSNIKDGNSLVDIDFYEGQLDFGEEKRVKPFSWEAAFPEVFNARKSIINYDFISHYKKVISFIDKTDELINKYTANEPLTEYGNFIGFDIIIGNPPYGALISKEVDIYLRKRYQVSNYQLDTFSLFIERGKKLLRNGGTLGYIIPTSWVASKYDNKLRRFLIEETKIENIVIAPKQTFKEASVETCILVLSNKVQNKSFEVERWDTKEKKSYFIDILDVSAENSFVFPIYNSEIVNRLVKKIKNLNSTLNDFADVIWGVKIYENGKGKPPQSGNASKTKIFHSTEKIKVTHKPLLGGSEITRYSSKWKGGFVDYGEWLAAPRQAHWFDGERILVREVTSNGIIQATIVENDFVFSNSIDGIKMKTNELNIKYILGIINSKLISFYHVNTSANAFKGTFPKVLLKDLRELPIASPNIISQKEIMNLVDQLLMFNTEKSELKLQTKLSQIQSKIDYCENRINAIVYQLYGLTEDEIKIVEGE